MSLKKIIRVGPLVAWIAMVLAGGCGDDGNGNPGGSNSGSGSLTDSRDGKTYKTVTIGTQTWMAENLNYMAPDAAWPFNNYAGAVVTGDKGSWCYNNSADSCAKYGRLYTWDATLEACPTGWRLPENADWDALVAATGGNIAGTRLKSVDGWQPYSGVPTGTDFYGFSVLPGGHRNSNGSFNNAGYYGNWWTATEGDTDLAYYRVMGYDSEYVSTFWDNKAYAFSVRCVAGD